ncbi:MAG: LLM class flavin-dependent oxidoreductase [Taibaiella sp.]|nr:LLM class flavin-dependent oxidoreductase [Taibaiella sp.]
MKKRTDISILELGPVKEGQTLEDAMEDIVGNAQFVEPLGYKRIWVAEHHNMPTISTAANVLVIGHIAQHTKTIRVGSGGIMLPNHTPLAIAEQFGTLDVLYPGRIDLGLGRAPGTDQLTAAALRRGTNAFAYDFKTDIEELQRYFSSANADARVRAIPGEGRDVPLWILGSSTDSAFLAAEMGLPYAFASHFAPHQLLTALNIYRNNFKPSPTLAKPYTMVAANVFVADATDEARYLQSSFTQLVYGILSQQRRKMPPPTHKLPDILLQPETQAALRNMMYYTFSGDKEKVRTELDIFLQETQADELIITNYIYDRDARHHSFRLLAEVMGLG